MAESTSVTPPVPDALHRLADDFLAHVRAQGRALKTSESYRYPLERVFLPWCVEQGIAEPTQLSSRVLDRFAIHLREEGDQRVGQDGRRLGKLSEASISSYSRSIRVFLRWAEKEGELTEKVRVPVPKPKKPELEVLSAEEIQRMEDAARSERDELLVRVLADTGIRLGELLGLRARDLQETDRGKYRLRVSGKTGERRVPVPPALARRLRRHLSRRHADPSDKIFVALRRSRRTGDYEPLTENGAEQAIRQLAAAAGIRRRVYPHLFRHSYATNALRKGMNVLNLQQILGHASLTMISQVYAHLSDDDTYEAALKVLLPEER